MKRSAFTLTELMVSLLIIGLITTTAVVAIDQVRVKGRDSQRITDIKLLQSALESYYRDENQYPATLNFGQPLVGSSSTSTYLSLIPTPTNILDGTCTSSDYIYTPTNNNHSYTLQFCLANSTNNAGSGYNCANPAGIEKTLCGT